MNRNNDTYNLERFIYAQNDHYNGYKHALKEIKEGLKVSHWIWYIFPQLKILGQSSMCQKYGISGVEEACAYLKNKTLHDRLIEITKALLIHAGKSTAMEILGGIDSVKVKSCMTLFLYTTPIKNDMLLFSKVLREFYDGTCDEITMTQVLAEKQHISQLCHKSDELCQKGNR